MDVLAQTLDGCFSTDTGWKFKHRHWMDVLAQTLDGSFSTDTGWKF